MVHQKICCWQNRYVEDEPLLPTVIDESSTSNSNEPLLSKE